MQCNARHDNSQLQVMLLFKEMRDLVTYLTFLLLVKQADLEADAPAAGVCRL